MADRKKIAVVGATGTQGGSLVRAILADMAGGFEARALTRKVDSDKAKALKAQGVEVMAADIDDLESVKRAFTGVHGAFCVTNFWEHLSPEREATQAQHMAEAAKQAGVKHVIWSTLDDMRKWVPLSDNRMPTLMGKYKVPHFDAKGESDHFFTDLKLPVTFLLTSFYWDNFIYFGMGPKKGPDGTLALTLPMGSKRMSGMAAEDIGRTAYEIFKRGSELIGQTVGVAGDHLTGTQMAEKMGKAMGKTVRYNEITPEVFRGLGFPGAEDLGNMFQVYRDFSDEFAAKRDIDKARALHPKLQNFDAWLAGNASRIPTE
ncbi:MAG TPA: NmrA/HSCARG family protein [Gemmatimonadales bacterium]|jgi:uncharacterized protein YbjT (DUF2867 family)